MKFGEIRKSLLIFCLTASVALHVGAVWFLLVNPLYFEKNENLALIKPAPSPLLMPKEDETILAEKLEKALEESLNDVIIIAEKTFFHHDIAKKQPIEESETEFIITNYEKKPFVTKPKIREAELAMIELAEAQFATQMPPTFDPEIEASLSDFALEEELDDDAFSYTPEKYASVDFSDHHFYTPAASAKASIEDDFTMTDDQFSPSALPLQSSQALSPHFVAKLKTLKIKPTQKNEEMEEGKMFSKLEESTSPKLVLPNSVDYLRSKWIKRSLAERDLPELEHYGLEEIASSLQWEENLNIDIAITPDADSNKYIFSLTVHPDFETDCAVMRQNFYFLIDRSSSIEKHKFNRFKRAVQRSMAALRDDDRFNIYIFDKKVAKLSHSCLPVKPRTIQKAEDFLDEHQAKTHFAAADIYTSIENILPQHLDPNEMHSVILITDGNTLLSPQKQKKTLEKWAKKFDGNVNFYTAASGKGNNLVLLDLLSYTTGGKTLYSDTNAAFPRKLVRLVKNLHNPIVKNLSIDISPKDSNAKVMIYPRAHQLAPMFAGQPYVLTGTIDELCDFTVFIQGRNHDKWLNIRKNIHVDTADSGGKALEKQWADAQSKLCYEYFLKNGKHSHLKEAKQIVAPYRGVISMDD